MGLRSYFLGLFSDDSQETALPILTLMKVEFMLSLMLLFYPHISSMFLESLYDFSHSFTSSC